MRISFSLLLLFFTLANASAAELECPNSGDIRFVIHANEKQTEVAVVHSFDAKITVAKGYVVKSIAVRAQAAKNSPLEFLCEPPRTGQEKLDCATALGDNSGAFIVPQKARLKYASIHLVIAPENLPAGAPASKQLAFDSLGDVNFDGSPETLAKADKCGTTVIGSPLYRARF